MLLTIDCGNTNILFAIFDGSKIIYQHRCKTSQIDKFLKKIKNKNSNLNFKKVKDIIISSVVPGLDILIKNMCSDFFSIIPTFVDYKSISSNLELNLKNPCEVGSDRIVNAIATSYLYKLPSLVVDFGTATTFDIILPSKNKKGNYHGGIIVPGVKISFLSLINSAEKLSSISLNELQKVNNNIPVVGKNTNEAMFSGIYWGYISLINGLIELISNQYGKFNNIVFTGGLSNLYLNYYKNTVSFDSNLTLKGLKIIFDLQKIKRKK